MNFLVQSLHILAKELRTLLGFQALRLMKGKLKLSQFHELKSEITYGDSILSLSSYGEVQRIVSVITIEVVGNDERILAQVGYVPSSRSLLWS